MDKACKNDGNDIDKKRPYQTLLRSSTHFSHLFSTSTFPFFKKKSKMVSWELYSFWDERKENSYLEIEGIFFIPLTYGVLYYYSVMFSNVFLTLVSLIFLVLSLGKRYACAGRCEWSAHICSYLRCLAITGAVRKDFEPVKGPVICGLRRWNKKWFLLLSNIEDGIRLHSL